jgi:hypothetical protein
MDFVTRKGKFFLAGGQKYCFLKDGREKKDKGALQTMRFGTPPLSKT